MGKGPTPGSLTDTTFDAPYAPSRDVGARPSRISISTPARRFATATTAEDRSVLASFLPRWMVHTLGLEANCPVALRGHAALMFADISGFSRVASQFAEAYGAAGAERLHDVLNRVFERLVDETAAYGGEVARFAGDGLLVHWPVIDDEPDGALARAVCLAARCALAVVSSTRELPVIEGVELKVHVAVTAGEVTWARIGGHQSQWEHIVLGEAIHQIGPALRASGAGEVVLSEAAVAIAADSVRGVRQAGPESPFVLTSVTPMHTRTETSVERLPREDPTGIETWVSPDLQSLVGHGHGRWMSEMRTVTVMFVSLGVTDDGPTGGQLGEAVRAFQARVNAFFGRVKEVSADDKGTVAIALFGLASRAGASRPAYAVACAQELFEDLRAQGISAGIGLSTDRVFCGTVGSNHRREYTTLGRAMILAARLAFLGERVRCDEATFHASLTHTVFSGPDPEKLKGYAAPVRVWRAVSRRARPLESRSAAPIGRVRELRRIDLALDALTDGAGARLVFEGEPGIGKSLLIGAALDRASARGLRHFEVVADAAGAAPYQSLRPMFESLLGVPDGATPAQRQRRVIEHLAAGPFASRAALLNPLLGTELTDSAATADLKDFVRAQHTRALAAELFASALGAEGFVLLIEDAHWLDMASVGVLSEILAGPSPALCVISSRPLPDDAQVELRRFMNVPEGDHFRLGALSPEEADALIAERLGVHAVPSAVGRWIHQRAQGHPLFCAELASALRSAGMLTVRDGIVVGAPTPETLEQFAAPATVEGTILQRFDGLPETTRWTLKAASVLGMTFDPEALRAVHPLALDDAALTEELEDLVDSNLCDPDEHGQYTFRHRITLEVAYGTLLESQRKLLHRGAAEHLERAEAGALKAHFPRLAHHWLKTDAPERAAPYLEGAWAEANRDGAMFEAYRFVEDILGLDVRLRAAGSDGYSPLQKAVWLRRLAEASVAIGRPTRMHEAGTAALPLLGERVFASKRQWGIGVLRESVVQGAHLALPRSWFAAAPDEREALREAAQAWTRLAEAKYYLATDFAEMIYAVLRAVNLVERCQTSAAVTTAYGQMGLLVGTIGFDAMALRYLDLAWKNALATGLPRELAGAWLTQVVVHGTVGRWEEALRGIETEALPQLYESRSHLIGPMLALTGAVHLYRGSFATVASRAAALEALSERQGNVQAHGWGNYLMALRALRRGAPDEALRLARVAQGQLRGMQDRAAILADGAAAMALAWRGDTRAAVEEADALSAMLAHTPPNNFNRQDAYAAPAEVYLRALQVAPQGERRVLCEKARKALKLLATYARRFAAGRPRHRLLAGLLARDTEPRGSAGVADLTQARAEAKRLSMPWEDARAALALAPVAESARRRTTLAREAEETLVRLGSEGLWLEEARSIVRRGLAEGAL